MFSLFDLEVLLPTMASPEYRKQLDVVDTYMQRLRKSFPDSFLDDFWTELSRLHEIDSRDRFVFGLRLGAQLTPALLQPLPKTPRP